jgi:hypothetical protein
MNPTTGMTDVDISKLSVGEATRKVLAQVLADFAAPDPAKPWTQGLGWPCPAGPAIPRRTRAVTVCEPHLHKSNSAVPRFRMCRRWYICVR